MSGCPSTSITHARKDWWWQLSACTQALVELRPSARTSSSERRHFGTGWLTRCNEVALVTARHVLAGNLEDVVGQQTRVKGDIWAKFYAGGVLSLAGCRALVPERQENDGLHNIDVVIVELPAGGNFHVRPLPCNLNATCAGDVGGDGRFHLLHRAHNYQHPVVSHEANLIVDASSASDNTPRWLVRHNAPSEPGSSGAMLVDSQCQVFAVHVRTHEAVLLSVVHERLGDLSPWRDVGHVQHTLPTSFHLPVLSRDFVGRESYLKRLHEKLHNDRFAVVAASTGLPGVGKSWLVTKYVHEHLESGDYDIVAWIQAKSADEAERDLIELGEHLRFKNPRIDQYTTQTTLAVRVVSHLADPPLRRVLLVFDNAAGYARLKHLVPSSHHCLSVFTSRNAREFQNDALPLDPFSLPESLELLGAVSKKDVDADKYHAEMLCQEVGNLPLAIRAVAIHARDHNESFRDVLDDVQQNPVSAEALNLSGDLLNYDRGVSVVRALSLVCTDLDGPNTRALRRLSLLAADRVPVELLGTGAKTDMLYSTAIVSYPGPNLLSIHPLVQQVAAAQMPLIDRQRVADELVQDLLALTHSFYVSTPFTLGIFGPVASHVEALLAKYPNEPARPGRKERDRARGELASRLGRYHRTLVSFEAGHYPAPAASVMSDANMRLRVPVVDRQ